MGQHKILFVLTNHDRIGPADDPQAEPSGFHLAEAATPWAILTEAGCAVDLVTPAGGAAPIDPTSRREADDNGERFLADPTIDAGIKTSRALGEVELDDYVAIYFPGGYGTMWDLPDDETVQSAVRSAYESGKVVAAVCHGPAALVNVTLSDGSHLVANRRVSMFTDAEEHAMEKESVVPFLLESELLARGAIIEKSENFEASVSIDGQLVTGQNPASAVGVAQAIRYILARARSRPA